MSTIEKQVITVEATINAPVEKVWKLWTTPEHIINWNNASPDWHTPTAENDLRVGGKFSSRMEAKDGSFGFDFGGEYTQVEENKVIAYFMGDGRKVVILFTAEGDTTKVTETFDAETQNSIELQRGGWQAILNNFVQYVETIDSLKSLHFKININAPVSKVYAIMLADKTYREWTAEFNPTSYFEGTWEKGSKILFLGTSEDNKVGGMVSQIKENITNKFVSIEHLGFIQDGQEVTSGPHVDGWKGALENYTFNDDNGTTKLVVDMMGGTGEYNAYFMETWPKALKKLKSIIEN
ncbi:MAG: SRPBCC family protein [Bacteroidota bacterium]